LLLVGPDVSFNSHRGGNIGKPSSGEVFPILPSPMMVSRYGGAPIPPSRYRPSPILVWQCALMLAVRRRRAQQAAMIFAGPPRVEAAHYVWCSSATKRRARLRRAMAPRADARRVTMLRSLTHVGEGTERRAPRRPSRCTAPEARRAQDGELPYRAEPARLTSEAPYATRGEGGGGRHPPPFCTIASVGKVASGIGHRETITGKGQYRESVIGEGQYRGGYHRGESVSGRAVSGPT